MASEQNRSLLAQCDELNAQLNAILSVASDLASELDFDALFTLIVKKITDMMNAERTSLYLLDPDQNELWTKVAEGIDTIRVPVGQGISGRVAQTGEIINVEDAWELPFFNRVYDKKNRFRTRSVLCLPIKNHAGEKIGVLQMINKKGKPRFDAQDEWFCKGLTAQVGIALENSLLHDEMKLAFKKSIQTLAATVDAKHPLTAGHSRRVTDYSMKIAKIMGLPRLAMDNLYYAALLHDIGKIGISDAVLLKNGPFTPEERLEMDTHPTQTEHILNNFYFPRTLRHVPWIAACHHEKIDGTGYPRQLTGEQIPLESKIITVADVFDALTSPRDYPKYAFGKILEERVLSVEKSVSILKNDAGTHFDPDVIEAFLPCIPDIIFETA